MADAKRMSQNEANPLHVHRAEPTSQSNVKTTRRALWFTACAFLLLTSAVQTQAQTRGGFLGSVSSFALLDSNRNGVPDPATDSRITVTRTGDTLNLAIPGFPAKFAGQTTATLSNRNSQTNRFTSLVTTFRDSFRALHTDTATFFQDSLGRTVTVQITERGSLKDADENTIHGGPANFTGTLIDANNDNVFEAFTFDGFSFGRQHPRVTVSLVPVDLDNDRRPDYISIPWTLASAIGVNPRANVPQVFIPLGEDSSGGRVVAMDFDGDNQPDPDLQATPSLAVSERSLYFSHFADGAAPGKQRASHLQLFSQVMLLNLDNSAANTTLSLRDDPGSALSVILNGESAVGTRSLAIPAGGLSVLKTGSQGPLTAGAVTATSTKSLAGVILFGGTLGLAGVGSSEALASGFVAPMENVAAQGVTTGIAMMALDATDVAVDLRLLDLEGRQVATARLDGANVLKGNGHVAKFLPEFSWTPAVDFSNFAGSLRVTTSGRVAATVLQVRNTELATMPVARLAPDSVPQPLYFAHLADGTAPGKDRFSHLQLFSQILLVNRDTSQSANATVTIRDDLGRPLTLVLNGETVAGTKDLVIPPGGMRILRSSGLGSVAAGSAAVTANRSLAGVILFGGTLGVAGVGSSAPLTRGFVAPMEINSRDGISTGIAMQSLEEVQDVATDLQLTDSEGRQVATARLDGADVLKANGHVAKFLPEFNWSPRVDFANFVGVLKATPSGRVAATVLQVRSGQLATMPVAAKLN